VAEEAHPLDSNQRRWLGLASVHPPAEFVSRSSNSTKGGFMRLTWQWLVVSLTIVSGGTWALAQAVQPRPVTPTVYSGADLGFRVVGRKGAKPTGKLVVRIDGQWVDVEFAGGVMLITK
jgi:hypothetical protein